MNDTQPPSDSPAPDPEPESIPAPESDASVPPAEPTRRRRAPRAKPKTLEPAFEIPPAEPVEPAPAEELPVEVVLVESSPVEVVLAEVMSEPPLAAALPPELPPTPPPPLVPPPPPSLAPPATPALPPRPWRQHFWAITSHLLLFLVIPTIFLGGVITFFLWQILGKDDPFLEDQAREALNFQINVGILSLLLACTIVGLPLVIVMWVIASVMCLIGAMHAARGERYRYPVVVRIVTH